jgi:transketolase
MIKFKSTNVRMWSMLGQRGTFGTFMLDLGANIDNLMVLTGDLAKSSGLDRFKTSYPDQFLNIGIAEQNMVGIAAGLAKEGHVVFATTFAPFATMRSLEQVKVHMGYMGFNVKLVGLASGLATGVLGNTHYGMEDLALIRAIPNLVLLSPADCVEVAKATEAAAIYHGPVYLRLTGIMNNPVIYKDDYNFEIGKAITLLQGSDITIIATGSMVYQALKAAKLLDERSISASVVNMHTIKPIDTSVIDEACNKKLIVTVEEHNVIGGLGGAVSEYKSSINNAPRQLFIGIPDTFPKVGDYQYLLEQNGLTASQIAERILSELD